MAHFGFPPGRESAVRNSGEQAPNRRPQAYLALTPKTKGSGVFTATWIFPADTPLGCVSETKERRNVLAKWGNDLRQTYRTLAQEAGVGELDVHLLMNHRLPGANVGYITRGALTDHLVAQQERISRFVMAEAPGS